jgi:glycosyltransferase involved in cell wall biosynthesis
MVTIVMPAFNEEDIIEASVREWHAEVVSRLHTAELLVVDDCSTDGTGTILDRLASQLPGVRVLRPQRNGGHGRAVRMGLQRAVTEYVFQTDSDRQHLPAEFWSLWQRKDEADFIFGVRTRRADGLVRLLITRSMRLLNFLLWGVWIRDANCPFKLMRRGPMQAVLEQIPEDMFIPMVAVSVLSRRMGYRVLEVEVTHLARRGGTQSLRGLLRWVRVARLCLMQLLALHHAVAGSPRTNGERRSASQ